MVSRLLIFLFQYAGLRQSEAQMSKQATNPKLGCCRIVKHDYPTRCLAAEVLDPNPKPLNSKPLNSKPILNSKP